MGTGRLSIDTGALADNWRALDRASSDNVETGAVVKADGYGLGSARVARALAGAGARTFFVAVAEEGAALREALGDSVRIFVFGGHMAGDGEMLRDLAMIPLLNSVEQFTRHLDVLPGTPFGVQLDSGMNRLGLEPGDWAALKSAATGAQPALVMSHLACADEPTHPMNLRQLQTFREMTAELDVPRSLAATGGTLLGPNYHFEMTRPGIGLYGGLPFAEANPVVRLSLPVVQVREVEAGETVGYGNTWTAEQPARIATLSAGYADGLIRAMGGKAVLYAGTTPCPLAGRVSMDLLTVDVTALDEVPESLEILGHQTVDQVADAAGTIGYEILTSLGPRYQRHVI